MSHHHVEVFTTSENRYGETLIDYRVLPTLGEANAFLWGIVAGITAECPSPLVHEEGCASVGEEGARIAEGHRTSDVRIRTCELHCCPSCGEEIGSQRVEPASGTSEEAGRVARGEIYAPGSIVLACPCGDTQNVIGFRQSCGCVEIYDHPEENVICTMHVAQMKA
jgi:hypothetical protein